MTEKLLLLIFLINNLETNNLLSKHAISIFSINIVITWSDMLYCFVVGGDTESKKLF